MDFPRGTENRNPPANAQGMGSLSGPGRFHMLWNNWAHAPKACATQQKKSLQWEAWAPQLEKVHLQHWKPSAAKN